MSTKILFFDTETTGLPRDYAGSYTDVNNWPRVISLAWLLTDENGEPLHAGDYLIRPDGWQMPTEKFWIDNGFSQEKSLAEGHPIRYVLALFDEALQQTEHLVAHNVRFDHPITWAEYIRAGMPVRSGLNKICTMMKTIKFVGAVNPKTGRAGKFPTLTELHTKLFGKGFQDAHDAQADMTALRNCFFELLKIGHLTLEIPVK